MDVTAWQGNFSAPKPVAVLVIIGFCKKIAIKRKKKENWQCKNSGGNSVKKSKKRPRLRLKNHNKNNQSSNKYVFTKNIFLLSACSGNLGNNSETKNTEIVCHKNCFDLVQSGF